jgi:hypothetical protein
MARWRQHKHGRVSGRHGISLASRRRIERGGVGSWRGGASAWRHGAWRIYNGAALIERQKKNTEKSALATMWHGAVNGNRAMPLFSRRRAKRAARHQYCAPQRIIMGSITANVARRSTIACASASGGVAVQRRENDMRLGIA